MFFDDEQRLIVSFNPLASAKTTVKYYCSNGAVGCGLMLRIYLPVGFVRSLIAGVACMSSVVSALAVVMSKAVLFLLRIGIQIVHDTI